MRYASAVCLALLIVAPLWAELKIVGEVKVGANKLVRLTAEGQPSDAALIWDVGPEEMADVEESAGKLIFTGPPGTYRVKCRSVRFKDGKTTIETTRALIVIGEPAPEPGPSPKPPEPTDPLLKTLQAAYDSEVEVGKLESVKALAAVYRAGAEQVSKATTWGQFWTALSAGAEATKVKGKVTKVQAALGAHLRTMFPNKNTDPIGDKARAASELAKVAVALEAVK